MSNNTWIITGLAVLIINIFDGIKIALLKLLYMSPTIFWGLIIGWIVLMITLNQMESDDQPEKEGD